MFKSAEIVKDKKGKQYHIGLTGKDISDKIILVGDPKRAELISTFFREIKVRKENREFVTYTGLYKNSLLTVISTGMGADNTEIAVIELCGIKFPLTVIRCGTCGGLQDDIKIGDLIISQASVRIENTTDFFVEPGYPAVSSYETALALIASVKENKKKYHFGITATASGFYGAQCRTVPGFPLRDPDLINRLMKQGVKNFEMETSSLFTLATLRGFRAGSVCVVVAERRKNKFINPNRLLNAELSAIKIVLGAFEILEVMDKQKSGDDFWAPDFK